MFKFLFCVFGVLLIGSSLADVEETQDSSIELKDLVNDKAFESFTNYLKEFGANITIIISQAKYYPDGTLKQIDSIGLASNISVTKKNPEFDLTSINQTDIDELKTAADSFGVKSFFTRKEFHENETIKNEVDILPAIEISEDTEISKIITRGYQQGLADIVGEILESTTITATITLLDHYESGKLRENATLVLHPKTVVVVSVENVSESYQMKIGMILKDTYRVHMKPEERCRMTVDTLNEKLIKYQWQGFINATEIYVVKDSAIGLQVDYDVFTFTALKKIVNKH